MPDQGDPAAERRLHGDAADAQPRLVLVFPGLSIMERQWLSPRMLFVKCPGCGASQLISVATPPTTFVHEDDACPILRRIEAAIALFNSMPEDFG
jgi:hypothetical protein